MNRHCKYSGQKYYNTKNQFTESWCEENLLKAIDIFYQECIGLNMISSTPMDRPTDKVEYFDFKYEKMESSQYPEVKLEKKEAEVTARTRMVKTKWSDDYSETSRNLAVEVTREIAADLLLNAGTKINDSIKTDDLYQIYYRIHRASDAIYRKTLMNDNNWWIFGNSNVIEDIKSKHSYMNGKLYFKYSLYADDLFPTDKILVGQKTKGDCYSYNPFVLFNRMEEDKLAIRYSKRLTPNGKNNYAVVEVL